MITRPDRHDHLTLDEMSWAVHGGNRADETTGAIRTPIITSNSYRLPRNPDDLDATDPDVLIYGREAAANQLGLQEKLARAEHGEAAAVFTSGMAALHATFFTLLNPGDHVIVSNIVYMGTWDLLHTLMPQKNGIEVDFVDIANLDAVKRAIRETTVLIHTEAISNPALTVADIRALADIAHEAGVLLTVDSTFTPPPLFRPLEQGADLVIHSLTKYINGHGDAVGGAVIGAKHTIDRIKFQAMHHVSGAISPFNAWLIMRGSITLPLRMRRHCDNALAIAQALQADPRIAHVAYPGLEFDPGHELALRQFNDGFGGVVSFALPGTHEDRLRFIEDLKLITSAVSLGHDETLIDYESYPLDRAAAFPEPFQTHGLIRLAVGLEDPADLIADLSAALTTAYGEPQ
jgi:cystathionine beta-lyase/cystathionine gamma-synthase